MIVYLRYIKFKLEFLYSKKINFFKFFYSKKFHVLLPVELYSSNEVKKIDKNFET